MPYKTWQGNYLVLSSNPFPQTRDYCIYACKVQSQQKQAGNRTLRLGATMEHKTAPFIPVEDHCSGSLQQLEEMSFNNCYNCCASTKHKTEDCKEVSELSVSATDTSLLRTLGLFHQILGRDDTARRGGRLRGIARTSD